MREIYIISIIVTNLFYFAKKVSYQINYFRLWSIDDDQNFDNKKTTWRLLNKNNQTFVIYDVNVFRS